MAISGKEITKHPNLHCQDSDGISSPRTNIISATWQGKTYLRSLTRQQAALGQQVATNAPMTDELHRVLQWSRRQKVQSTSSDRPGEDPS